MRQGSIYRIDVQLDNLQCIILLYVILNVVKNLVQGLCLRLCEILDFSPFGFTAKADASGVDLKVRVAQDDIE